MWGTLVISILLHKVILQFHNLEMKFFHLNFLKKEYQMGTFVEVPKFIFKFKKIRAKFLFFEWYSCGGIAETIWIHDFNQQKICRSFTTIEYPG